MGIMEDHKMPCQYFLHILISSVKFFFMKL